MKYTLKQLKEQNKAYAEHITSALLEYVNKLIKQVEQTRTDKPQPLDDVDYISEHGEHTEHATIDGVSVSNDYKTTICEHCTPKPIIMDDGTVTAYIGCGGAFYNYNADKMKYKGTEQKTCVIHGGDYSNGYYPIYFDCVVSSFEYDARNRQQYAEQAREKAIQRLIGYGYDREIAEQAFDTITETVYTTEYQNIDEYSPIIRHANECLYGCGMLDRILTEEDLKALDKA